jgi:hypothetical protein
MSLLRILVSAYLVAGAVHVLKMLALASFVSSGPDPAKAHQGRMVFLGLLRVTAAIYVRMILAWPVAVFNGLRNRPRPVLPVLFVAVEPIAFVVALAGFGAWLN